MPYAVVWATALEGGSLMSRVDAVSIASGISFLLLLLLSGVLLVRWLAQRRGAAPTDAARYREGCKPGASGGGCRQRERFSV